MTGGCCRGFSGRFAGAAFSGGTRSIARNSENVFARLECAPDRSFANAVAKGRLPPFSLARPAVVRRVCRILGVSLSTEGAGS